MLTERESSEAAGARQGAERSRIDRRSRVEMHHPLGRLDVLGDFQLPDRVETERAQTRHQPLEDVAGRGQQLACAPRVAQLVSPLAEEAGATTAQMQPRAHTISLA